jgi:hypothetical protein
LLTLIKSPKLIEAAFNKIIFEVSYQDYTLGDLFYLDVLDVTGNTITTLVKNGSGFGFCSFDVSSVVQSMFPSPKMLNHNVVMQKDETALLGYKVKIGVIKLIDKVQVKQHYYTSDTLHALRAALPYDNDNISNMVVDYSREATFLTSITPNQSQGSDIFLPVLVTAPTTVKLIINYYTTRKETVHTIPSIGVYIFNVKPEIHGTTATGFSTWLEADAAVYIATVTATVNCGTGFTGSQTATATDFSSVSLSDAQSRAMVKATDIANANLVCETEPQEPPTTTTYTSTQSYTATCSDGYTGSYTSTQTRTSTVSQADADTKAMDAARIDAQANVVCTPNQTTTYSSTKTYTATCPTGYEGSNTSTQTRTSTISQADADSKAYNAAKDDAESNLYCTYVGSGGGGGGGVEPVVGG